MIYQSWAIHQILNQRGYDHS